VNSYRFSNVICRNKLKAKKYYFAKEIFVFCCEDVPLGTGVASREVYVAGKITGFAAKLIAIANQR